MRWFEFSIRSENALAAVEVADQRLVRQEMDGDLAGRNNVRTVTTEFTVIRDQEQIL